MTKNDDIIKRIIERRAVLGWSQSKLATMAKVAPAQISRYESGKSAPSAQVLGRLANAMAVPFDWLVSGSDESGFENTRDERGVSVSIEFDEETYNLLEKLKNEHGVSEEDIIKAGLLAYKILNSKTKE